MSRDITAGFKAEATAASLRPVLLSQAFFDSETIRFWNGIGDFIYNGDSYTGAGDLLNISSITETGKIEARGVNMTLSGIPSSLIAVALTEEYQDRQITIDLAFLDENNVVIADPFRFFSGKADVMSITDSGDTATISLSSENDLIALQRINVRRRTSEDQKLSYLNDSFFDGVAGLISAEIKWGG